MKKKGKSKSKVRFSPLKNVLSFSVGKSQDKPRLDAGSSSSKKGSQFPQDEYCKRIEVRSLNAHSEAETSGKEGESHGELPDSDSISFSDKETKGNEISDAVKTVNQSPSLFEQSSSPNLSRTLGEEDTASISASAANGSNRFPPDAKGVYGPKDAATGKKKADWAALFADNRNSSDSLSLQWVDSNQTEAVIEERHVNKEYGFCLAGYFSGRTPKKEGFERLCDSWSVEVEYHIHSSGWIIFKFDNVLDMRMVMEKGPFFVNGSALLLKVMPKFFRFENKDLSRLPIWVKLVDLPICLWTSEALSIICSKFGRPLHTDKLTATKQFINYARVLVEVDVAEPIPSCVKVKLPDGSVYSQGLMFEQVPNFCKFCEKIGHSIEGCRVRIAEEEKAAKSTKSPFAGNVAYGRKFQTCDQNIVEQPGNKGPVCKSPKAGKPSLVENGQSNADLFDSVGVSGNQQEIREEGPAISKKDMAKSPQTDGQPSFSGDRIIQVKKNSAPSKQPSKSVIDEDGFVPVGSRKKKSITNQNTSPTPELSAGEKAELSSNDASAKESALLMDLNSIAPKKKNGKDLVGTRNGSSSDNPSLPKQAARKANVKRTSVLDGREDLKGRGGKPDGKGGGGLLS